MIIEIRRAYSDANDDIDIYIGGKIKYLANIGKKIRLYDKSGGVLIKVLKKSPTGKAVISDENGKNSVSVFKRKDSRGKIYYGMRPKDEGRVYRVQIFQRDGIKYLLFTEDKKFLSVAKSTLDGRVLYKLYSREQNADLSEKFLLFVLFYMKLNGKKIVK